MIHSVAIKITNNLIHNKIAEFENREIYIYGLELLLGKFISYISLFLLALYLDLLIPTLLFSIFFLSLRGRTGGFHASNQLLCFISSMGMYFICALVFAPFLKTHIPLLSILLIISTIYILIMTPVNHPNLDLNSKEISTCKQACRYILLLEWSILSIAYFFKINTVYIVFPSLGIIMCSVLIFISKLTKQEVAKNEKS